MKTTPSYLETTMRGQVRQIAADAKVTGKIEFGGEYSFGVDDSYQTALDKLYETGCQIGGSVSGNGSTIKVFPCYDHGYWSFEWLDQTKGVRHVRYWTAEVVSDDAWNEESAKLLASIRKPV